MSKKRTMKEIFEQSDRDFEEEMKRRNDKFVYKKGDVNIFLPPKDEKKKK